MRRPRLILTPGPVARMHELELLWWLRKLLEQEQYEQCQLVEQEFRQREAAGRLRVALIVEHLSKRSTDGQPVLSGLNGLLAEWPNRYPHLFSPPESSWRFPCLN